MKNLVLFLAVLLILPFVACEKSEKATPATQTENQKLNFETNKGGGRTIGAGQVTEILD